MSLATLLQVPSLPLSLASLMHVPSLRPRVPSLPPPCPYPPLFMSLASLLRVPSLPSPRDNLLSSLAHYYLLISENNINCLPHMVSYDC